MITANTVIRRAMHRYGVPYWLLAHALGCSEGTLYRRMRFELPEDEQRQYLAMIEEIARERDA